MSSEQGGASSSVDVGASTRLDESLWGTLQHHICLADNVYPRLPFEEFFNLRVVCKEWYDIACKRLALKERIHKPFFPLFLKGEASQLDGVLSYNARNKSWDWFRVWSREDLDCLMAAAIEDVIIFLEIMQAGQIDWKEQRCRNLELPPIPLDDRGKWILGIMSCGDAEKGCLCCAPFKIVCAGQEFDTHEYDSKTGEWQTKPCRPEPKSRGEMRTSTGCAACRGRVYITTAHKREIFVYDFDKASWSSLKSPCKWESTLPQHYRLDTLGAWNGRVFDVAEEWEPAACVEGSLCVWELVDESTHEWDIYDRMPRDLYSWLRTEQAFSFDRANAAGSVTVQGSFCGDYLLVYSWDFEGGAAGGGAAGRCCLFNMATKNWQKLDVPAGLIFVIADSDYDSTRDDIDPWRDDIDLGRKDNDPWEDDIEPSGDFRTRWESRDFRFHHLYHPEHDSDS